MPQSFAIVYFKRDLRIVDQEAVFNAAKKEQVRYIYIFEPSLWQHPTASFKHFQFLCDCLKELAEDLARHGRQLEVVVGEAHELFSTWVDQGLRDVYSLQETGNGLSYKRDLILRALFIKRGVTWHEYQCNGVFRGKLDRDTWAQRRDAYMFSPQFPPLSGGKVRPCSLNLPSAKSLGISVE